MEQRTALRRQMETTMGNQRGKQTTLASGLRSIFKQIAAAGKAEKSISISYSGKKEKFSLVKGELKAQSAL